MSRLTLSNKGFLSEKVSLIKQICSQNNKSKIKMKVVDLRVVRNFIHLKKVLQKNQIKLKKFN